MKKVKKAYFPYNLILWIFKKTMCRPESRVAMIDPLFLQILTIGKPYELSERHYNHEACHIEQVKKEGRFKFVVKYLFYNIKYGYWNNPYEVEARSKTDET